MKLPKIDLSKDGMKRFVLYHIEKVILLLAIAGLGVFFWLGFKTESFADTDPEKLSQKADSARTYILNDASWDSVNEMRITRDNADSIVKNTKKLKLDGYDFSKPMLGTPRQSLGLRHDPDIDLITPRSLEVDVVVAPTVFRRELIGGADRTDLDKLDPARERNADPRDRDNTDSKKDDDIPKVGDVVSNLSELVGVGFRSTRSGSNSGNDVSLIKNVVAVRAVIDHKKFWDNVESKLKNTYGYFPERDRPNYKLVQIERKEGNGAWKDRTIYQGRIESVYSGFAPEVVDPSNYDAALTGQIPPMPLVDYRHIASHSLAGLRDFDKVMEKEMDEAEDESDDASTNPEGRPDDPFGNRQDESDENARGNPMQNSGPIRMGSDRSAYQNIDVDKPSGDLKVVRFFDLWDVKPGKQYTYRFRIWTDDPNHELDKNQVGTGSGDDRGDSSPDRGGRPGGISGLGGGGASGVGGAAGLGGGELGGPEGRGGGIPGGLPGGLGGPGGRGGGPGGGPRGGNGGGSDNQPIVYRRIPIPPAQKHISVRNRIDDHLAAIENDVNGMEKFVDDVSERFGVDLTYCRATNWVEVTVTIPETGTADTLVGEVVTRQTKSPRREPVTIADQIGQVLISEWSSKFGTLISKFRQVRKGDWLNFEIDAPTNVLHIVDNQMKKLEEYEFQTDQLVVDLMGGEKIDVGARISPVDYKMPGEILLMDEAGNVVIHNSFDEKGSYLLRSQMLDETSEYNQNRRRPASPRGGDDDEDDGRIR